MGSFAPDYSPEDFDAVSLSAPPPGTPGTPGTPSGVPGYGGCPWPVDPACFGEEWDAYDEEVKARAVALASSTLARLTGYRVGTCPITVRPCKPQRAAREYHSLLYYYSPAFTPLNLGGAWINSCGCAPPCSCTTACEVTLPAPVTRVEEVKVNGDVIDPENYRIDNGNILVWQASEECPFPASQNLALADTEDGTFAVTYLNAYPVDANGAYAAGVLSAEYARACGGQSCRLPAGVTTVVRQGLTMEIPSGAFPGGLTGIREVDAYIALWNPLGLIGATRVYTPDMAQPRYRTG